MYVCEYMYICICACISARVCVCALLLNYWGMFFSLYTFYPLHTKYWRRPISTLCIKRDRKIIYWHYCDWYRSLDVSLCLVTKVCRFAHYFFFFALCSCLCKYVLRVFFFVRMASQKLVGNKQRYKQSCVCDCNLYVITETELHHLNKLSVRIRRRTCHC